MAVSLPTSMLAGHEPSADEFQGILNLLNSLKSVQSKDCSATLTLTAAEQDIAGCSATVTVAGSNAFVVVYGSFDLRATVIGTGTVLAGRCNVGGVTQTGDANLATPTANIRASVSRIWKVAVPAGNTVVKLRALISANTGTTPTASAGTPHTNMTVFVFDVP